jgi:nitrile hydratase
VTQRFAVGDVVRTRSARLDGHTRLPRYLERRVGHVEAVHGAFELADERAEGATVASSQALYCVVFDGAEVWGAGAASLPMTIAADLWDSYLDPEPG